MADFNPYHKWLGIPPEEQPVSYYRLLGIARFEMDADVIETAAERQTLLLRTLQTGPNSELAERLLNEVSAARVSLLDEKSKARYDTQLRATLEPVAEDDPLAFTTEELAAVASGPSTRSRQRSGSRAPKPFWKEPWAIPAAAGGIVVLLLLIMMLFGSGEDPQGAGQGQEGEITSLTKKRATPGNQQSVSKARDVAAKSGPAISEPPLAKAAVAPPLAVAPFDAAQAKAHQQVWSKYLGVPIEYTNSIGMTLTLIPPGEFMMGSPKSEAGRDPRREHLHRVTLTRPFGMGMHEVTQEQYEQVMGKNPSKRKGEQHPAEAMTWREAIEYCRKLSDLPKEKASARVYRLPTEAEWEYVCRAGTTTAYSFGDDASKLGEYAWYVGNSGKKSHPIGEKNPNPWGVCGMHGNVFEWCHDWFGAYPSGSVINPMGPTTGKDKLNRGGSFNNTSEVSRSAERGGFSPSGGHGVLGFRVVLEIPVRAQPKTSAAETKSLPASLQQGLIAYYPFNGNANDESGNGNDGTVLGATVTQDRFGQLERAYDFDGRDDQIMVRAMHWPHGKSPRTVVAWFKSSAEKPGNIVSFGDGKKTGRRFSLRLMPGKLYFCGENRDATFPLSPKPSPQTWGQYAVVYDGSIVACYWQGQAKRVFPMNLDTDGRFPLVIGSNTINRRDEFFKGAIDDVRVYNRALSAAEVEMLYEFEKP